MATAYVVFRKPVHTSVLLHRFPISLHRAMKAKAVRQGITTAEAYAAACRAFLRGGTQ